MCRSVLSAVAALAGSVYHLIFNDETVDDFERRGKTVASVLAPGGGGRLMAKLGGLVPRWLGATVNEDGVSTVGVMPCAEAQLWDDFCLLAAVVMTRAGVAFGFGGYQCVYGPSLLYSRGDCPAQLPHIDQSAPVDRTGKAKKLVRMNPIKPNLSLLVALQDNTRVVVYPHSHRYLPESSGGCLTKTIEPLWLVLNRGDVLLFRQDLVHHGASSTTSNHSVHWYIDAGRQSSKQNTFYVNPVANE